MSSLSQSKANKRWREKNEVGCINLKRSVPTVTLHDVSNKDIEIFRKLRTALNVSNAELFHDLIKCWLERGDC